jgi:glycogen(starch) synthase
MAADLVKQEGFAGARFLMTVSETDPLFQDLCSMASRASLRLGIDIVFRTFDRHQMATIYRSARACIVPSPDESFGQTVLEAFVYRCPVIAANSAGLKEVIRHEVNGLHFDVRSSEDLRRHLLRLESSPRLRDQLVANGEQEVMTRFNSMRMASDHRRVYSAVWQSHKRKGPAFR